MQLEELLNRIDENQNRIDSHGKLSEEVLKKVNYKFRLEWNYYSNRMEGGTLTKQETRSVMVGNININDKPMKDVMEMNGHDKVVLEVLQLGKGEKRISEKKIKDVHKAIMFEQDENLKKEVGEWKSKPNEIINYKNEKIPFVLPGEVADRMHKLLDKINADLDLIKGNKPSKRHPLLIASDFHLDYITIHPFYDGNGRTARIFTNLILIACGLPVIVIKDEHKQVYYQYLADIQVYGGSPDLFYKFIGERIVESQQIVLDAIEGKEIEEVDDLDKRIALVKKLANSDDKVSQRRSAEAIYNVTSEIAFSLFNEMEKKCVELNSLFVDNYNEFQIMDSSGILTGVRRKDGDWSAVRKDWLETEFREYGGDTKGLLFRYRWNGFKKSIEGQSVQTALNFYFDEYNYVIYTDRETRDKGIKRVYNSSMSLKDRSEIIKRIIDPVLDQIEGFIQRK